MSEERDQPVAEEGVTPETAQGVADEANAQGDDQPQLDEDGNPIEAADDDSEEIEHEGAKYKLPKALAKEFREGTLRQGDYTRKTQELAEQRRSIEARATEIDRQAEARQAVHEERVKLAVLDAQLDQVSQIDWGAYAEAYGQTAALKAMGEANQLKAQRDALAGEVTAKEAEFVRSSEQVTANALREAHEVLSREVQGYGNEMVQDVAKLGASLGFTGDELRASFVGADGKADTRTFKALVALHQAQKELADLKAKQTKQHVAEKQAAVTPAKTVSAKAGQYKAGLNDDLPPDEWLRRRNAQVVKSGGR